MTSQNPTPSIVVIAPEHGDILLAQFGRYAREYDVVLVDSAAAAEQLAREIVGAGRQVAMFVCESRLPGATLAGTTPSGMALYPALARLRGAVPTARLVVAAYWDYFREDSEALRPGLAKGKYDAFMLMPRGVRDEEFHTAICELLSDWGQQVAAPETAGAFLITPVRDSLTMAIRDLMDRVGIPNVVVSPDSPTGTAVADELADSGVAPADRHFPIVKVADLPPLMPRTVHDLSILMYGRPDDIEVDTVVDVVIIDPR